LISHYNFLIKTPKNNWFSIGCGANRWALFRFN
jgi:hypothetical protein